MHLLPQGQVQGGTHEYGLIEPSDAKQSQKWEIFYIAYFTPVPLVVTVAVFFLNATAFCWQDLLGHPNQSTILQALQYAAKAHEVAMAASLTAVVVHRTQYDLGSSVGVPIGFLAACFQLSEPLSVFRKEFLGGVAARVHSKNYSRFSPLPYSLILGLALTLVVGPSSAVAMIPRLHW